MRQHKKTPIHDLCIGIFSVFPVDMRKHLGYNRNNGIKTDRKQGDSEVEHVITICIWTVRGRKVLLFI